MTQLLLSKDLKKYIDKHRHAFLKVHSVFGAAINMTDDHGNLMTLVDQSKDIGPMSAQIAFSGFQSQDLEAGELVEIEANELVFPRLKIKLDLSDHEVWNPEFQRRSKALSREKLALRVDFLKEIIQTHGQLLGIVELIETLSFDVPKKVVSNPKGDLNQYADFIEERLLTVVNAFYHNNLEGLKTYISKFVGFGPGLTPSTDDFLLGLIISYIYDARSKGQTLKAIQDYLAPLVGGIDEKTTVVSVHMLKHGVKGKVSHVYRSAVQAMYYDVKTPFEKICMQVLQNGSTSGSDFLFGVYCYSQLRLKRYREGGI